MLDFYDSTDEGVRIEGLNLQQYFSDCSNHFASISTKDIKSRNGITLEGLKDAVVVSEISSVHHHETDKGTLNRFIQ